MKSVQIIAEELKKGGLDVAEEVVESVALIVFDKVIPRLALEADEAPVKMIAGVAMLATPAVKEAALKAIDKIDGQVG